MNPTRIQALDRAVERWRNDLVDTSGRNRLRRYRDLRTGTLDLTPGRAPGLAPGAVDRLLSGRSASLSGLFSEDEEGFEDARRRLTAIRRTARTNLEEKGIETLFVAVGLATWEVESGTPPSAPVVLLPVHVESTGAASRDFSIEVSGDVHLNPVLTHILRAEHDIETGDDEADVLEDPPTSLEACWRLLCRLISSWQALPNLELDRRVVASVFSYSTLPLVADLELNGELFAASDIVAAIAGVGEARLSLARRITDPRPNQPDIDPPANEFLALDADSSQHMAINRVLGGESLVIQGPPGTGKSQTIANLISVLVACGKRVLFVAEKRAAIEAVTKRLEQVGLIDIVMDMHGGITSRRDFARTLNASLEQVASIPASDYSGLHARLQDHRRSLIANNSSLHEIRLPWGLSVFEMRERVLAIPESARTLIRLTPESARELNKGSIEQTARDFEEWVDLHGQSLSVEHPEWARSSVVTADSARRAFNIVTELQTTRLPAARDAVFGIIDAFDLVRPETVSDWDLAVRFLGIASGSWWSRLKAKLFSKDHRRGQRVLGAPAALSVSHERLAPAQERVGALTSGLDELADVAGIEGFELLPEGELQLALQRMVSARSVAAGLPRIRELEARFRKAAIIDVVEGLGNEIAPDNAGDALEHAWLSRVLDDLEFEDQRISGFDSSRQSRRRDEFAEADRKHLGSTPQRVHRLVAEAVVTAMNDFPNEATLVRREAAKKSRHLSVRQLLGRAPHVLTSLRPCWTMSPILVAEMIPADLRLFDVVVFDEASQIPPAEGISSLARAPQAVIAGDSNQLPPTSFFSTSATDDGEEEDDEIDVAMTRNIESLLDVAGALLRDTMLRWHYRSRDDRLIAFSNNHIYQGSLTAFPGATLETPVRHILIPYRPILGVRGTRSNPDEVAGVVDLVLEHAHEQPDETLGVIAFGQHHADSIENALMRRLGEIADPALDRFFSEANEERFFIKNIERVQGDERDNIILSVGYHKDANGRLPYRFGPLLQDGGERRLNVAVTRARSRLTLISSFDHRDMDPGRSTARGVELLRRYLEYASAGGDDLGSGVVQVPLNPFELSVKNGLDRRGIPASPQYGVSGYRVDFACAHPCRPGQMVLAIEADGASYHSTPTARDRDRLRQEVLESKGWRFHRIWSTAWFRDREGELDRAEGAWKRAVELANRQQPSLPDRSSDTVSYESAPTAPQRGPRPPVPPRGTRGYQNIADYTHRQLVSLARWIESDTLLRTDDDLLREMMAELGFRKSGTRIRKALQLAIRDARRR